MKFQKTVAGVVVQTQRSPQAGFIECDESVHCGLLFDGINYSQPGPTPPIQLTIEQRKAAVDDYLENNEAIKVIVEAMQENPGASRAQVGVAAKAKIL